MRLLEDDTDRPPQSQHNKHSKQGQTDERDERAVRVYVERFGDALTDAGMPRLASRVFAQLLSDDDGQVFPAHSISAGLDYPGVGPEHAFLRDAGRAEYVSVTDDEALDAFLWLSRTEGIIPALESAHAVAYVRKLAPSLGREAIVLVNLSGRGDKDAPQVRELLRSREAARG